MPPVNSQISSSHEAAGVAKEENCSPTVFLGITQPLQHVRIRPCSLPFRKCLEKTGSHSRDDITWREGVDANSVLAPFCGKVPGQLDYSRLGGIIRPVDRYQLRAFGSARCNLRANQTPVSHSTAHASNQHHASFLLTLDHLPCYGLGRHEDTSYVDAQHLIRILGGILESRRFLLNSRGGNKPVNVARLVSNGADNVVESRLVSNVNTVVLQARAELLRPGCYPRKIGALVRHWKAVQSVNGSARLEKGFGLSETDSTSSSRDDDHLVLEAELRE